MKVSNMRSAKGNDVSNQFIIESEFGVTMQSYRSIIAFKGNNGVITLDEYYHNYSRTTSKYLNQFLGCTTSEKNDRIKEGTYKLANLNP